MKNFVLSIVFLFCVSFIYAQDQPKNLKFSGVVGAYGDYGKLEWQIKNDTSYSNYTLTVNGVEKNIYILDRQNDGKCWFYFRVCDQTYISLNDNRYICYGDKVIIGVNGLYSKEITIK